MNAKCAEIGAQDGYVAFVAVVLVSVTTYITIQSAQDVHRNYGRHRRDIFSALMLTAGLALLIMFTADVANFFSPGDIVSDTVYSFGSSIWITSYYTYIYMRSREIVRYSRFRVALYTILIVGLVFNTLAAIAGLLPDEINGLILAGSAIFAILVDISFIILFASRIRQLKRELRTSASLETPSDKAADGLEIVARHGLWCCLITCGSVIWFFGIYAVKDGDAVDNCVYAWLLAGEHVWLMAQYAMLQRMKSAVERGAQLSAAKHTAAIASDPPLATKVVKAAEELEGVSVEV